MSKNTIEGIFNTGANRNFIVLIRTKEETLEQMNISAPFAFQVLRADEKQKIPCRCIKIICPPGSDHMLIKTEIHPMAKKHGINSVPKINSNHLIIDVNT